MTTAAVYEPTLGDLSRALTMLSEAVRKYAELSPRQLWIVSTLAVSCKQNGATWEDIGRASGLTKQMAHKRWGHGWPAVACESDDGYGDPEDLEDGL